MLCKVLAVLLFVFNCNLSPGQTYFDLFSTNVPKAAYDKYSVAFAGAFGWLGTGNYERLSDCITCFDYSRDSKLKKEKLDSLVHIYKKSGIGNLYSKVYVPNNQYFSAEKVKTAPYIIKTLYRMKGSEPTALHQLKITFYDRPNNRPGVLDIEIINENKFKQYEPGIVITAYKNKLREDAKEKPPSIEKIKD